ncbi:MAG: hypothetical protein RI924_234 [Bacteroidota bacterium]|jgi:hypothetical protein
MKKHIRQFFVGKVRNPDDYRVNVLNDHFRKIQLVWEGDLYDDYGVERVFRLFLISAKLLFPGIYIQQLFCGGQYIRRKMIGELYVIAKTFVPFLILYHGLAEHRVFQALNVYLLLETLVYVFNKIYVSEHETGTAHKRSLLLLFLNYFELVLAFGVIYSSGNHTNVPFASYLDAIYFSLASSATIGFGDIYPVTDFGKSILICQALTTLSFVVLFFNFFGAKLRD